MALDGGTQGGHNKGTESTAITVLSHIKFVFEDLRTGFLWKVGMGGIVSQEMRYRISLPARRGKGMGGGGARERGSNCTGLEAAPYPLDQITGQQYNESKGTERATKEKKLPRPRGHTQPIFR